LDSSLSVSFFPDFFLWKFCRGYLLGNLGLAIETAKLPLKMKGCHLKKSHILKSNESSSKLSFFQDFLFGNMLVPRLKLQPKQPADKYESHNRGHYTTSPNNAYQKREIPGKLP